MYKAFHDENKKNIGRAERHAVQSATGRAGRGKKRVHGATGGAGRGKKGGGWVGGVGLPRNVGTTPKSAGPTWALGHTGSMHTGACRSPAGPRRALHGCPLKQSEEMLPWAPFADAGTLHPPAHTREHEAERCALEERSK